MLKTAQAALSPYLLWIKLGFIALVFAGGMWSGCSWKEGRENKALDKAVEDRVYYQSQAQASSDALVAMNKQASDNARRAEEQKELADRERQRADANKALIAQQAKKAQTDLDRAYNNPDCKKVLEQKLCPLITDF